MPRSVDEIFAEVSALPDESKCLLLERLVEDVSAHVDPEIERVQLEEFERRYNELKSGAVKSIPLDEVLARARRSLRE